MPLAPRHIAVPILALSLSVTVSCGTDPETAARAERVRLEAAHRNVSLRADSIARYRADSTQKAKALQAAAQELKKLETKMGVWTDKIERSRMIGFSPTWGEQAAARGWTFQLGLVQAQDAKPMLTVAAATRTADWLFWDEFVFNVDGTVFRLAAPHEEKNTKVNYGSVSEWWVGGVLQDDISKYMGIATGKDVRLRFSGRNGTKDVQLQPSDKSRINDALRYALLYNLVNGKP